MCLRKFHELQNQSYIDFDNGFFTLDNFSSSSEEVPLCCDCSIDIDLTSVCKGDEINLVSYSNYEVVWPNNSNANSYSFIVESDTTFNVFFMDSGNIMCHDTVDILMLTPQTPIITDLGNSLLSSQSTFYQWYLNGLPIDNENSQIIQNVYNGEYNVFTIDKNGCGVFSDLYIIDMLETFDCINNECVNLGLGTGIYSNIESCQTNCQSSTYIIDEKINPRLTKVVNMFGQETGRIKNSLLFFLFDDGTVQKKYILTY